MSDNNAHPGVRSLLAKFENSPSQVTSPPSRGRSPVGSDTPSSSRPLSKVRASFVTVDGVVQSASGSPLRKTSGRSDSPGMFGPKIDDQAVEARRDNLTSPTPGGLHDGEKGVFDQALKAVDSEPTPAPAANNAEKGETKPAVGNIAPATEIPSSKPQKSNAAAPAPAPATGASEKPTKTVTKRPSTINATKSSVPHKPTPSVASPTTKQPTATATKSARETAKERAGTLASKPSRASLNPSNKTTPRAVRGSTPAQESSKTSPNSVKSRPKSPTKPVRLPPSMTAQTQASSAKLGSGAPSTTSRTSTTASTLTRKPSTLKSAAGAGPARTVAGTTTGVRRQPSRPSLPAQPAQERPGSRVSDGDNATKPVNDSFLARMMRPTASSASKSHEKTDAKPVQKPVATTKAPRASMGRAPERVVQPPKAKTAALRPQSEKSPASNKEPAPKKEKHEVKAVVPEPESEKENIEESTPVIPEEPEVVASDEVVAERPNVDTPAKQAEVVIKEESNDKLDIEAIPEAIAEPADKPVKPTVEESSVEAPVQAPVEAAKDTASDEVPQESAKPIEKEIAVEPTVEAPEASPVPEVNDVEVPAEAAVDVDDAQDAAETQTESTEDVYGTPTDSTEDNDSIAAVTPAESAPAEDLEISEVPQQTDGPIDVPETKEVPEISQEPAATEDSSKSEAEPAEKVSTPTQQPAADSKQAVEEIDFVSLALN